MDKETRIGLYSSLLADELAVERAKKSSFEARGMGVISASGTLVGITFGFVALATSNDQSSALPKAVVLLLAPALGALVVAAAVGLWINVPVPLPHSATEDLVDPRLHAGANFSLDHENLRKVETLKRLRQVNRSRARWLSVALLLEVMALLLMTVSVVYALGTFHA